MNTKCLFADELGTRLRRSYLFRLLTGILATLLLCTCTAGATASPYKLCFNEVTGLPAPDGAGGFAFPLNPPAIDGEPDGDTGWTGAFRYVFQNGTNQPYGAFQAIKQGNMVYFSAEVTHDNDFDQWDAVVLGFDNLNAADPHRYTYVVVYPVTTGFGATKGSPLPTNHRLFWQSNDHVTWLAGVDPIWINAEASSAGAQTTPTTPVLAWKLEVSIDNSNSNGPKLPTGPGSAFALYVNVIRTYSTGPSDTQFTWPPNVFLVDDLNPSNSPPDPSLWGNATLNPAQPCSGVYFDHQDIYNSVTGGSSHTNRISWTQPNTFTATVHNSSTAVAHGVVATFKIANFGLPTGPDWGLLGRYAPAPGTGQDDSVANNPTVTPVDIPGAAPPGPPVTTAGSQNISAGPWSLGGTVNPPTGNKGYYSNPSNEHQCVLVELNSASSDTTFVNRSTWNNFDLSATASEFKSYPAIVSANYPPVPGTANQMFDLTVSRQEVTPGGTIAALSATSNVAVEGEKDVHFLSYVVDGCRHAGKYLSIQGPATRGPNRQLIPGEVKKFENCESVGAFGYLIRHQGAVKNWDYQLSASGAGVNMKSIGGNQYQLVVPQGTKAQLASIVTPVAPGGCTKLPGLGASFFLLAGIFFAGLAAYRPLRRKE